MANGDFVREVSSYVSQSFMAYVTRRRHVSAAEYSKFVFMITNLLSINSKMVENLFCQHILKDSPNMEALLQNMLETYDEDDDESDDDETQMDEGAEKRSNLPSTQ